MLLWEDVGQFLLAEHRQEGPIASWKLWRKGVVAALRIYKDKDEMIYIFDREINLLFNDNTVKPKGALAYIPSGTVYSISIDSSEARCLNLHTRAGFEDLMKLVGTERKADRKAQ
jgi:hypothetical protein